MGGIGDGSPLKPAGTKAAGTKAADAKAAGTKAADTNAAGTKAAGAVDVERVAKVSVRGTSQQPRASLKPKSVFNL